MFARLVVTPIGTLALEATEAALTAVRFEGEPSSPFPMPASHAVLDLAERELHAYFGGSLQTFTLPLAPAGTPFQQRVWEALLGVPYGEQTSYRAIAIRIGSHAAVRAVGAANGRNPIPIVIPCHRIVGARGELTGYGGGLPRKKWLLEHEQKATGKALSLFP